MLIIIIIILIIMQILPHSPHHSAVSPEARRLVAEILGMPRPGQFSVLMDTLDEAGLAGLRQHAARMGLM